MEPQGVLLFDPATNKIGPFLPRRNLERFNSPNDLTISSKGDLYFTDQDQTGLSDPTGCVYRLTPGGRLDCLIANGVSPNGLALSPDERFRRGGDHTRECAVATCAADGGDA
ncbi:hypothetical protein BO99DRAFT_415261 [Aspergillus violaceofuscus CBS 115571]|uniref:SMP-30/Gluconolactonase/LRE-like region domain-containing protein n=1 Tax=Aspergillus violaceofuscus (strain CBS 115571) TaxID=1450538 RepID=A0A2V5H5W2_ASPV1|nr:hypothetical protein BO99DRAFT_415261 [Aspergillus violaceofuscus CBS 115571]